MAPSSDSSAWRLCGGTRAPGATWCRRRVSAIGWPIGRPPRPAALGIARGTSCEFAVNGRWTTGPAGSNMRSILAPGDDLHGDPELHVAVQLHRHLVHAEGLDGLVEVQPAPVEVDA